MMNNGRAPSFIIHRSLSIVDYPVQGQTGNGMMLV